MNYTFEKLRDIIECFDPCMDNYLYVYDIIPVSYTHLTLPTTPYV